MLFRSRKVTYETGKTFDSFISNLPAHVRMCEATLQEDLFDEFLLIGVAEPGSKDLSRASVSTQAGLSGIRWRALVGTNISEPFHTCRIQFDFGDYSSAVGRAGSAPASAVSVNGADRRSPLELHADWAAEVWEDCGSTTKFVEALKTRWLERRQDEAS